MSKLPNKRKQVSFYKEDVVGSLGKEQKITNEEEEEVNHFLRDFTAFSSQQCLLSLKNFSDFQILILISRMTSISWSNFILAVGTACFTSQCRIIIPKDIEIMHNVLFNFKLGKHQMDYSVITSCADFILNSFSLVNHKIIRKLLSFWTKSGETGILKVSLFLITKDESFKLRISKEGFKILASIKDEEIFASVYNIIKEDKHYKELILEAFFYHSFPLKTMIHLENHFLQFLYTNYYKNHSNYFYIYLNLENKKPILNSLNDLKLLFVQLENFASDAVLMNSKIKILKKENSLFNLNQASNYFFYHSNVVFGIFDFINHLSDVAPNETKEFLKIHSSIINHLIFSSIANKCENLIILHDKFSFCWDNIMNLFFLRNMTPSYFATYTFKLHDIDQQCILKDSISKVLTAVRLCNNDFDKRLDVTFKNQLGQGQGPMKIWFSNVLNNLIEKNVLYLEESSGLYSLSNLYQIEIQDLSCTVEDLCEFLSYFFHLILRFEFQCGIQFADHLLKCIFFGDQHAGYCLDSALKVFSNLDPLSHSHLIKESLNFQNENFQGLLERLKLDDFQKYSNPLTIGKSIFSICNWKIYLSFDFIKTKFEGQIKDIDCQDWLRHLVYRDVNEDCKSFFKEFLLKSNNETRKKLFTLVTARKCLPFKGFVELNPPFILEGNQKSNVYPVARTCFHLLQIPNYTSKEAFNEKMNEFLLCNEQELHLV